MLTGWRRFLNGTKYWGPFLLDGTCSSRYNFNRVKILYAFVSNTSAMSLLAFIMIFINVLLGKTNVEIVN